MTVGEAEALAADALAFVAGEPERLAGFLRATGATPHELAATAGTRDTLLGVLAHLLENESELLVFTSGRRLPPGAVAAAHGTLAGRSFDRGSA